MGVGFQAAQLAAALAILIGFCGAQLGRLRQDSAVYLWLNFAGSAVLAVQAGWTRQWGFLLLEGAWAIISAAGLWAKPKPS